MLNVPGVRSLPFISRNTIGATSAKHAKHMRGHQMLLSCSAGVCDSSHQTMQCAKAQDSQARAGTKVLQRFNSNGGTTGDAGVSAQAAQALQ